MFEKKKILRLIKGKFLLKLSKYTFVVILIIFLIHPGRFARRYDHVPDKSIRKFMVPIKSIDSESCPLVTNASWINKIPQYEEYDAVGWGKVMKINLGGWWTPENCEPVHHVALVIPYRDRPAQLSIFLKYMHEFLQNQFVSYRIFVIEQASGKPFNRGKLMNVGYKEALKLGIFPCFIFHDVDLLPEGLGNIYGCTKSPRHMSASINIWRYNLLYHGAFGGVISILADQFQRVNGFSNLYFGWGAEDDDFLLRIRKKGMEIIRFSPELSRYYMLPHKEEQKNAGRFSILDTAEDRIDKEGLNSLNYDVLSFSPMPLYTYIVVQL